MSDAGATRWRERSEFGATLAILRGEVRQGRCVRVTSPEDWRAFKRESRKREWVYLYRFSSTRFAWGTSTRTNDRLRAAGMLESVPVVRGKYDRRVDFLMLRLIHGRMPDVWVAEAKRSARAVERAMMEHFHQSHCYRGLARDCCRRSMAEGLLDEFRRTSHWKSLSGRTRRLFSEYMKTVFFRRPPLRNSKGVAFRFGDTLEPGFVRRRFPHLADAIAEALRISFPARPRRKRSRFRRRKGTVAVQ